MTVSLWRAFLVLLAHGETVNCNLSKSYFGKGAVCKKGDRILAGFSRISERKHNNIGYVLPKMLHTKSTDISTQTTCLEEVKKQEMRYILSG